MPMPADLIIHNVSVITMDPLCPHAIGVAITNGKCVGLIHNEQEAWPLAPHGQRIDGQGMTLLPGLIDAHCHLRAQISRDLAVSCGHEDVDSIEDIQLTIRERANLLSPGTWIRATGYDLFYLQEQRHPTRWDLDKATSNHPVRLRHVTRHATVLNSAALALAGIGPESIDPPGVTVERDATTNMPTGLIYGGDAWLSQHVLPALTTDELHIGAKQLQSTLLRTGITAVQDATPTNTLFDLQFWSSCIQDGWPITIQLMTAEQHHEQLTNALVSAPDSLKKRLEMGPVKVVIEALPHLFPDPHELSQLAAEATRRDIPLSIHVVDPEMTWAAIEAIRYATERYPEKSIRHRFEHLSLCPDAFLPDISALGITVVTNPSLIHDHGDRYHTNVDVAEHSWLYRMHSVLAADIPLAAGSDAPVASFNPWIGIQTACTRATLSGAILGDSEKLERQQALALYTTGAARAAGWELSRGMIRPGFHADVILVDQNPLTCSIDALRHTQVAATWIDGKLVYHPNLQG
ncbi:amidohydrolase [Sporosarcina sp. FSL K6-1522]|uniref:amidohydrolase n=1 Tax=Sporosarcina sp. FSL K6-1522 TaxID=2921554 RepID=UPI00315B3EAA